MLSFSACRYTVQNPPSLWERVCSGDYALHRESPVVREALATKMETAARPGGRVVSFRNERIVLSKQEREQYETQSQDVAKHGHLIPAPGVFRALLERMVTNTWHLRL